MDMNMRILISAQDAASQVISGLGNALGPVGGAFAAIGVAAAGAAIAIGVQAVKAAADFQTGMTTLVTGAGESQKNMQMVSDGILSMAVATGTSTKQLTDGMYMIESAGFHGAAGLAVLKSASEGAKVGNAQLGTVADATTTIMLDFGLKSSQSAIAVNTLIATVANGKTTMQALSGALSQIMPTASAAGVSLNDTSAALATMTGEGVPAANAATYLRQTILGLEAPSAGTVKALKAVGLTSAQVSDEMKKSLPDALQMITDAVAKKFPPGSAQYVAAIKNISGGAKTMQGMLDLTGTHLETFRANVTNISDAVKQGGSSITGWALVQQTFNFKLQQAQEVVETLMIKIGTALLPVLTNLMNQVMPLITQFSDWITTSGVLQSGIASLSGDLSGAGGVMSVVKGYVLSLVEAAGRIIGAFGDWLIKGGGLRAMLAIVGTVIANIYPPVSRLITVVSKIIADFIEWGNRSGTFNGIIRGVGATVGVVSGIVGTIIDKLASFIGWLEKGSAPANALKVALAAVAAVLLTIKIGNMISDIIALIPQMIAWIATTWAEFAAETALAVAEIIANWPIYLIIAAVLLLIGIVVLLVQHWSQVISFLRGAWSAFASWFMGALHAVGAFFVGVWNWIVANARTIIMILIAVILGPFGILVDLIIAHWNQIVDFFRAAWAWIVGIFQSAIETVVGWFSWLYNHNYYFQNLVNLIMSLHTRLLAFLHGVWSAITGFIVGVWNWLVGLAASYFGRLFSTVSTQTARVQAFFHSIWTSILGFLSGVWSTITGDVSSAWGKISGIFSSAWGTYVQTPLGSLKNSIVGFFTNLAHTAVSWGENLISGFVSGITGSLGKVGSAVGQIMSKVGGFLGFHSPSKEGPGTELDQWGPNLIKGFMAGMLSQLPALQSTLHMVMAPVQQSLSGAGSPALASPVASPSASTSSGGGNTIILNVTVNASPQNESEMERIAKFTLTYLTEHVQGQFGNLYAGGR